jgi:hypothetical protein
MSSIVNKVKDAMSSDKSHEAPEGTHGPHATRTGNTLDPRVDSDRDGRANPSAGNWSSGGNTTGYNDPEGTHGPHGTRAANALDPRVDSDRDNRGTTGGYGSSGLGGTGGYGSSNTTGYNDPEGTHGPHGSRAANALDPRVESDPDNRGAGTCGSSRLGGSTGYGYGSANPVTGRNDPEGTHGPHGTRTGNTLDPRVDSDRDGRSAGGYGSTGGSYGRTGGGNEFSRGEYSTGTEYGSGPGPAPNTAGPHRSDLANKVDPRVDSDRDNSRTLGRDRTYE